MLPVHYELDEVLGFATRELADAKARNRVFMSAVENQDVSLLRGNDIALGKALDELRHAPLRNASGSLLLLLRQSVVPRMTEGL